VGERQARSDPAVSIVASQVGGVGTSPPQPKVAAHTPLLSVYIYLSLSLTHTLSLSLSLCVCVCLSVAHRVEVDADRATACKGGQSAQRWSDADTEHLHIIHEELDVLAELLKLLTPDLKIPTPSPFLPRLGIISNVHERLHERRREHRAREDLAYAERDGMLCEASTAVAVGVFNVSDQRVELGLGGKALVPPAT
jgi:hypothetical protein